MHYLNKVAVLFSLDDFDLFVISGNDEFVVFCDEVGEWFFHGVAILIDNFVKKRFTVALQLKHQSLENLSQIPVFIVMQFSDRIIHINYI